MKNFIVFLLTLTMVIEMPFRAFAGYEAEKLSLYPILKTISLLEKYKDRPDELFVSGELKNHPFAANLKELLAKQGVKKLPNISRVGYSLIIDDGPRKISIFSKYAYAGVFLIDGKVFSVRDYSKFSDAQKAMEEILNKKRQTSFLDLFIPKAEAQAIPPPNVAIALAVIASMVFALGFVVTFIQVLNPNPKPKEDFPDKKCIEEVKRMNPENLPANEESLRKLVNAYGAKLNSLIFRFGRWPTEAIYTHATAVKALEDLDVDCSKIRDKGECEKLKTKHEEGRRLALQELNKIRDQRLQGSVDKNQPVSLNNAETANDCLKLYDRYFWEVYSKMPEAERNKIKLSVNEYGQLDMDEKNPTKGLKVPPLGNPQGVR